eukprot:scaffold153348_cov28-Tisochrysis_lutea.AAC.5
MNQKHLLRFIKKKCRTEPNTVVSYKEPTEPGGVAKPVTLAQVPQPGHLPQAFPETRGGARVARPSRTPIRGTLTRPLGARFARLVGVGGDGHQPIQPKPGRPRNARRHVHLLPV